MGWGRGARFERSSRSPHPSFGHLLPRCRSNSWQRCDGALNYTNPETRWRPRTSAGAAITNGTEIYQSDRQTFNTTTPSSPNATPTFTSMGTGITIASASGTAVMVVTR